MIDGLKPYPAYKDSGIPWLGQVPAHWEVRRLKYWIGVNLEVLPESTAPNYEFKYLDIGAVGTGRLVAPPQPMRFRDAPSRARRIVRQGDTVVSTVRTYLKAVYFVEEETKDLVASTGFAVLTPTPQKQTEPKFVSYLAQSDPFTNRVMAESIGIAYPAIAETRLASFAVTIPPLPEQTAIVRLLDYMDRRIRRYILAQQKLIKLLKEYKQALIHQAVTGRIDVRTGRPYPAYKDSGVEWLGKVPEYWEVRRLRTVVEMRVSNVDKHSRGGEKPVRLCNYVDVYKHDKIRADMNFMRATASDEEIERFRLQPGDVLITKDSEMWNDIAVPALVETSAPDLISGYHLALLRPRQVIQGAFLFRAIQSPGIACQFHVEANGVTRFGLSHDAIKSTLVPLPPLPEQTAIVEYLDAQTAKLDAAIAAARREIELLREYGTRLIADVVTGKLDVREVAAQLPEEPTEDETVEPEPMDEAEALAEDGEDEEGADLDAVAEEVGA